MAWVSLLIAGLFEVVWAVAMKYSAGFTRFWPSAITVLGMILSFLFLAYALKSLPLGTAYAVWTGIGAVGTVLIGIFWLGESRELLRIFCVFLIITGIIGLKLVTKN
jgi:quaternary ammonium compound-resistance protein SugE